jgi:hypothetical protein
VSEWEWDACFALRLSDDDENARYSRSDRTERYSPLAITPTRERSSIPPP